MIAYKELSRKEYNVWKTKYDILKAKADDNDIQTHEREMESDMGLLGCVALRDQLQDDVKEVVRFIRFNNNIKFWIITGDKE